MIEALLMVFSITSDLDLLKRVLFELLYTRVRHKIKAHIICRMHMLQLD